MAGSKEPLKTEEEGQQNHSSLIGSLGSISLVEIATICNVLLARSDDSELLTGILSQVLRLKYVSEKQQRIVEGRLTKFYKLNGGRFDVSEQAKNETLALASTVPNADLIRTEFQIKMGILAFKHRIPLKVASHIALKDYFKL